MSRATTTQKSTKRNLSSPSSPNLDTSLKKSKSYVTPNRFAPLSGVDNLPEVFSPPPITVSPSAQHVPITPPSNHLDDGKAEVTSMPAPPMVISNVTNYSSLKADLISLMGTDGFSATAKGSSLIIKSRNLDGYQKLVNYCNNSDLECHTWALRHIRPFKVFIRYLHHTIPVEDIERALRDLGFSIISVLNIRHRVSKQALPLFSVVLEAIDFNQSIFQLSSLLNSKIVVEKPHQSRYPPQCKACQRYGHTRSYCSESPRCVKCGNNHFTIDCVKSSELPAKCALCSGAHTANYKGCPSLKKFLKTYHKNHKTGLLKSTPPVPPLVPSKAVLPVPVEPQFAYTRHKGKSRAKTYAEATSSNSNNFNNESISNILSQFVTQLNSLITPLISLLSTLLNSLLSKNTVSP